MAITIMSVHGTCICEIPEANTRREALEMATERGISLSYANLRGSKLYKADLKRSDFCHADFTGSTFIGCDFSDSLFLFADLSDTLIKNTKFYGADFGYSQINGMVFDSQFGFADFSMSSWSESVFVRSDFFKAIMSGCSTANSHADECRGIEVAIASQSIVPQSGSFVAFKAFRNGVVGLIVVPDYAKRTNGPFRWCRASEVLLSPSNPGEAVYERLTDGKQFKPGDCISSEEFSEDKSDEGPGVSFFLTKEEALAFLWEEQDEQI
jgi:uncharacterized protein YjbI with pentapeptide repeats